MFVAIIRALGRLVDSRGSGVVPLGLRRAHSSSRAVTAQRVGAGVLIAAAALAPVAATAQSAGCARVNGGSLNYEADFGAGNLNRATSRFSTAVSDQAANSIRITATSDQGSGTAAYDPAGSFAFAPGDVLTTTAAYNSFTAGNVIVRFRIGTTATAATDVTGDDIILTSGNGTVTRSYTVTGSETAIGVRTFKQQSPATTPTGNVGITVTCASGATPPAVTGQPSDQTVPAGATASFSVTASGSPSPAVQWQMSSDGGATFTNISGATASPLTFTSTPADSGRRYRAVLTNGSGTATTSAATLTVVAATSIAPTSGPEAGGTEVVINGTGFNAGSTVAFGATAATGVVVASATQLRAISPAGTGTVNVRVTTNGATSAASAANAFTYLATPTVTALSPTAGPTAGGNAVTITGTNFAGATSVNFGGAPAASFVVNSNTQITATAPMGPGTVNVTVTTSGGTSATAASNQYSYIGAPTVTALSPSAGPTAGGTSVIITGTNLTSATAVVFGATAATAFTVNSATQITATAPAGSGTVDVRVTTAGGTSATNAADQYTYVASPTVTDVAPNAGSTAGGTTVTITGTNFAGATAVTIGGTAATSYRVDSAIQITATTPAGPIGLVSVTVVNAGGTSNSNVTFRYVGTPTANDQSVSTGFNTARAITLTGTDPNTPARTLTYTVATQAQHGTLSGTAPNLAYTPNANYIGSDSFTFTVSNGVSTSALGTVSITVAAPPVPAAPVVTAPANGSVTNDTTPTVTGTTAAGTTVAIYLDGTLSGAATIAGTSFSYTPATALGEGSHTVYAVATNVGGPSPRSATNTFTVDATPPAAPTILTPANGSTISARRPAVAGNAEAGSTVSVTINGTLAGTTTATAGGYSFIPPADLPVGSNTVSVAAIDAAGNQSATATSSFTVVAQPAVSTVSPATGATAGGTAITITGTNLTGVTAVTVGGNPATNVVAVNATTVTATTPAGTAGGAVVAVTNQAGTSTTNGSFTYVAPPVADAQTVTTAYNTAATVTLTANGNPTSYTVVTAPSRGTLTGTAPNLTYTPTAGTRGSDSFTFTASNAVGTSAPATVTLGVGDPTITVSGTPPAGPRGAAYTAQLTASGGTAPYSFSVASGALPPGLTISSTGAISGTPTASGSFQVAFTVTDASNPSATVTTPSYTIAIAGPAASISPPAGGLPGGTVGIAYSIVFTTSGATAPYSYAVTAGTVPPGMTLGADGRLSGRPTGTGTFNFTVTSTDSSSPGSGGPYTVSAAYTLTIRAPTITVAPATLPGATGGQAYSQQLTANGGTAPYTFTTAGPLPAGLTLSSTGLLSGTPTQAGNFTFTVVATDSSTGGPGAGGGYSGSRSYTLSVAAPTITVNPATVPGATAGQAYSQTLTATGGSGTYTYTQSAGALPPGITISDGGVISGTPTAGGNFTFTITATDAGGFTGARGYVLSVAPATVAVTPATLPDGTRGVSYSQALTATGGTAPYAFSITAGALPAGLSLAANGTLAGQPAAVGNYTFTVTARDASTGNGPFAGNRTYTLTITAATIALAPATLPAATTRTAYSQTLSATGGTAPYRFAITAGALPAGVALAIDGTLSGSPTVAGSYAFTATATDAFGNTGARSYTLVVSAPAITLAPTTLPDATTRIAYSQAITATGGAGSYSYAVTAGALPAGITLSATGTLSGSATQAGSFAFTVTATDANGNAGSQGYTLVVTAPTIALTPTTLPNATTRVAYIQAITATGGTAPYAYAVTAGALPTGLTFSSSGTLSGTASATGSFTFTVTATDANGNAGAQGYMLTVAAPAIALDPATLAGATVGGAYAATINVSGGTAPYAFTVTAGTLPAGITLASDGALSGTPTAGGSFTFTATATDANGNAASRSYTLSVAAATIAVAPGTLPAATTRIAYSQTLTATGGTAPYSYAVTAGALPAGLTLATNGTLAGTATTAGSYVFTVTATDSSTGTGPYAGTQRYTLVVSAPAITLAPQTLPGATTRIAYTQAITTTGGTPPYTYAVTAGALPAGITLSATGTLSGSATQSGSFAFTVTATDANGNAGSQSYTLVVTAPTIALAPTTLPDATTRVAYSQAITATGGTAPYSYAVTAGALPAGITLSPTGTLSGSAMQAGSFAFTVTATDANGNAGAQSYTLTVAAPAIALDPATLAGATVGSAYAATINASGGTAPYAFAVTAGALPAGVPLASDGALSGTPSAGGTFTFTATATDANGNAASRSYTLSVAAATVVLAPTTLPAATTRIAYSQALSATGGTAPYSYAVTAGALPAGITLASNGTLAGTATTAGSYAFTVTVTDSSTGTGPYAGTQRYTLVVSAPAITLAPTTLPGATTRIAYSHVLTTTGGTAPYDYAVTSGALPAGITLSATGTLSGSATQSGSFAFTVTATDANGNSGAQSYTLGVTAPTIALAPQTLPNATTRVAYTQAITATGGTAPYAYAVTAGALPTGLTLSSSGTLSGTASTTGSFTFTVSATDANGNGGSQSYTLTVAAPAIALDPAVLADASVGQPYRAAITANGGVSPYRFAVTSGVLPTGVTLANDGTLAGTPTSGGTFAFTVTAIDANGNSAARSYSLTVTAATVVLAPATLADGQSGVAYSQPLTASGGVAPYSYAVTAGTLPAGVTLSATGTLSGTPTQSGSFTFSVTATDSATGSGPYAGTRSYALRIAAPALALTSATLNRATVGAIYNQQLAAGGGTAPYAFRVTAGALPAGITLASDGTLSGTPTAGGDFAINVTATDATTSASGGPYSAQRDYVLTVAAPTLAITPAALPDGAYQAAYSQQLSGSGGVAPYRYALTRGTLPAGITLSPTGLISGTPTTFGRFELTITLTDSASGTGPYSIAQSYVLTIQPPASPVAGAVSATVAYASTDNVIQPRLDGGAATALAVASQPAHGAARVEGTTLIYTPAAGYAGADAFTYTATNAGGTSAPATVTVSVTAPSIGITPASLPDARQGEAYSQQLSASGGAAPYSFAVDGGTLPAGMTLSIGGLLSGTPTASGSYTFAVRATDSSTGTGPFAGTRSYTLAVQLPAAPSVRMIPPVAAVGSSLVVSGRTAIALADYVAGTFTALEVVTQPQHGAVTIEADGRTASYIAQPNYAGADIFQFVAVGPGGRSPPATVALQVAGTAPVVRAQSATTVQGTPVTVDVTLGASGGPFTGAAVTAITPADAVTARVEETGTTTARSYRLVITPALTFSGTATIAYTLSNQFGASAPAIVAVTVTARPDPSADPTVNALSAAQADATRRFARGQADNFLRRAERLHNGGSGTGGRDMGVTLSLGGLVDTTGRPTTVVPGETDLTDLAMLESEHARDVLGAELASGAVAVDRSGNGAMAGIAGARGREVLRTSATTPTAEPWRKAASGNAGEDANTASGERRVGSVGLWSGGAITVGTRDADRQRGKMSLTTGGLSAGVDLKLADTLILGVGGGYGSDRTRISGGQAIVNGDSWTLAGYGSWSPVPGLFVDAVGGAGNLSFDTRRQVVTGALALGRRDGRMAYGSLAAGFDRTGNVALSAYGRVDYLSAHLDRFTETGGGIYGLTFARRGVSSLAGVIGSRVSVPLDGWTPRVRVEWRHEFADLSDQLVDYADVANLRYATRGDVWARDAYTLELGSEFALGAGWSLNTEIGVGTGSGTTTGTLRAGVRKEF